MASVLAPWESRGNVASLWGEEATGWTPLTVWCTSTLMCSGLLLCSRVGPDLCKMLSLTRWPWHVVRPLILWQNFWCHDWQLLTLILRFVCCWDVLEWCDLRETRLRERMSLKLQALVYSFLPPTVAIADYTVGLEFFFFFLMMLIWQ